MTKTNRKWNEYFDTNIVNNWSILSFHEVWIKTFRNDPGKLQYQKANDALVRSLRSIIQHCNDNAKVKKAGIILEKKDKRNNVDVNNLWSKIKEPPNILNIDDDCTNLPENYQLQEDYYSLFNDYNEDKLSDLIDDDSLIEETSLPDFEPEEITFDLESLSSFNQNLKYSFIKYQNSISSSKKIVTPAYWGILDLTRESLFDWKEINYKLLNIAAQIFTSKIEWLPKPAPKKLQEYFNNKCKDVIHGFENLHIYIQFIKLNMDRLKRFISEQELKMTTIFPLIRGTFSLNVIDDKWGEVQSLATNEARNESNNPFQRAKVDHKADMKGILINTPCKLEALYGEVSGGLGSLGLSIASRKKKYLDKVKLSIMMRDSINKALKQWKHISDENRKSLVLYGFTQDGLEINFYAMSWFEGIYLFGRIDSCMVPSEEDNSYLFEDIYCVLKELELKLKNTEEIIRAKI